MAFEGRRDLGDICEQPLVPELRMENLAEEYDERTWFEDDGDVYCARPVGREADDGRCIWHTEREDKPVEALARARDDCPQRLDGAILPGIEIGDALSFEGCRLPGSNLAGVGLGNGSLSGAVLWEADLRDANLSNSELIGANLHMADLTGANLRQADLADSTITNASLNHTDLVASNLSESNLDDADLTGATLEGADLSDVTLRTADLSGASLGGADFADATIHLADLTDALGGGANFTGASLGDADLAGAQLPLTDFSNANLSNARMSDTDLSDTNLVEANLEKADLTRANLFDADLTGAKFHGTVLSDVRLNADTTFGNHYTDDSDDPDPDKAAWTLRQLERLFRENALPEKAREAYLERKDRRRRQYWDEGEYLRATLATGYGATMRYGESPWRVVGVSLLVIVLSAVLYPLVGGIEHPPSPEGTTRLAYDLLPSIPIPALPTPVADAATSLYFSVVTFTTLGYGDLRPASGAAQAVATVESFVGALLMALLVFVLGRRATR